MNRIQNLPLEKKLKAEIESECSVANLDKNQTIVKEGSYMQRIPLLLKGSIRFTGGIMSWTGKSCFIISNREKLV